MFTFSIPNLSDRKTSHFKEFWTNVTVRGAREYPFVAYINAQKYAEIKY